MHVKKPQNLAVDENVNEQKPSRHDMCHENMVFHGMSLVEVIFNHLESIR